MPRSCATPGSSRHPFSRPTWPETFPSAPAIRQDRRLAAWSPRSATASTWARSPATSPTAPLRRPHRADRASRPRRPALRST